MSQAQIQLGNTTADFVSERRGGLLERRDVFFDYKCTHIFPETFFTSHFIIVLFVPIALGAEHKTT